MPTTTGRVPSDRVESPDSVQSQQLGSRWSHEAQSRLSRQGERRGPAAPKTREPRLETNSSTAQSTAQQEPRDLSGGTQQTLPQPGGHTNSHTGMHRPRAPASGSSPLGLTTRRALDTLQRAAAYQIPNLANAPHSFQGPVRGAQGDGRTQGLETLDLKAEATCGTRP